MRALGAPTESDISPNRRCFSFPEIKILYSRIDRTITWASAIPLSASHDRLRVGT